MELQFEWDDQKANSNLKKHSVSFEQAKIVFYDHTQVRPNRFANQQNKTQLNITLDPDVAEIFTTSEAVNNALRAILSAIPKK
jgi:uncharacterized DUF497 family protein